MNEDITSGPAPSREERPLGELVGEATRELGELMRKEMLLAKTELREEASLAAKGGVKLAIAGATGYLALLLASVAAAWGLAEIMPAGWAFLIVAAVHATIAIACAIPGLKQLRKVRPVPEMTVASMKEDADMVKSRVR